MLCTLFFLNISDRSLLYKPQVCIKINEWVQSILKSTGLKEFCRNFRKKNEHSNQRRIQFGEPCALILRCSGNLCNIRSSLQWQKWLLYIHTFDNYYSFTVSFGVHRLSILFVMNNVNASITKTHAVRDRYQTNNRRNQIFKLLIQQSGVFLREIQLSSKVNFCHHNEDEKVNKSIRTVLLSVVPFSTGTHHWKICV